MKARLCCFLILSLVFIQTGCASIISGREQELSIDSDPQGASVELDGIPVGQTPMSTIVKRKERHHIILTKDGYLEERRVTRKGYNWWATLNILVGGIVGIIIDTSTGAVYSISPNKMNVPLSPK